MNKKVGSPVLAQVERCQGISHAFLMHSAHALTGFFRLRNIYVKDFRSGLYPDMVGNGAYLAGFSRSPVMRTENQP